MQKFGIPLSDLQLLGALVSYADNMCLSPELNVLVRSIYYKKFPEQSGESGFVIEAIANAIPNEHNVVVLTVVDKKLLITTEAWDMTQLQGKGKCTLVENSRLFLKAQQKLEQEMIIND